MAKTLSKSAYDKWREKYGVKGTPKTVTNNSGKGKQSNSAPSARTTPTENTNTKSAYDKWREKYGLSGKTTQGDKSYSNTVKRLQDKGIKGASGIMTESEWRRRNKNGGTYQDYLNSAVGKFEDGTITRHIASPEQAKEEQIASLKNALSAKKLKYTDEHWQTVHDEAVSRLRAEGQWDSVKIENRAWAEVDELRRAWEKEKEDIEKQIRHLSGVRDATWKDATVGSFERGYQQSRFGDESYDKMMGYENEADDINALLKGNKYQFEADGYLKEGISGAAELIGQMGYMFTKPETVAKVGASTLAGAGTASIIGKTGPQLALPEEFVTVPAGAMLGFRSGIGIATAENSLRVEAGHAYNEMLEHGISHETAKNIALAVGTVNAALEVFQTDELIDAFKVLNKSNATSTVATKIMQELVDRGVDIAKETAQEVAQEGITMGGTEVAHRIDKGEGLYSAGDVGERLWDTTKSSALAFGFMNAPATALNLRNSVKAAKSIDDINQTAEAVNTMVESDGEKIQPLSANATEKEITNKKKEITSAIENVIQKQTVPDTLEKAAMEVVANRNAKHKEQQVTVADVKKSTGFGDYGSVLIAKLVNDEGYTYNQAKSAVETAYRAGLTGLDSNKATFVADTQKLAFEAGREDKRVQDIADKTNATNVVVNKESGFVAENLPSDVTQQQIEILDLLAKAGGVKAYVTKGLKGNAELRRATGEVPIDFDFEREVNTVHGKQNVSIVFHAAHEIALHRVVETAGEEGRAFVYEMYKHIAGNELSTFTLADEKRSAYAEQNVEISLAQAMEEISANHILYLYNNNEAKFHNAIENIVNGTNTKAKQGLRKYIEYLSDIIRKLREFLNGKTAAERAEIQTEIDEVRRLRDMFESAFAKSADNVNVAQAKQAFNVNSAENLEIKTNEEYNGSVDYSLWSYPKLNKLEWTLLNDRLAIELHNNTNFIDEHTKWLYATKNSTRVFAIYGIGWGNDATPLYAVGGKIAEKTYIKMINFMEEKNESFDGSREDFESWLSSYTIDKGATSNSVSNDGNRRANIGNGTVHSEQQASNGKRADDRSTENIKEIGYSHKDSEGNTLTEAQAEFFKDSKVRDENGNLLVVYHGTRNGGFTVFNRNHNYYTDNRDMADSYAPSGVLYKGYLNITKPYTIDAGGEKWSAIPVSEEVKRMLDSAGSSTFKERGKWCTSVADIVAAVSDLVDEGEADYDGVIVSNVDDTGSYYKGSAKNIGNDYISFSSEQFKDIDNKNPTNNPDINFSLKETVEETRELVAVHNVSATKLLKTLKLGGMPMPSIAITRAREGYNNFGDISLVFGKETIDPRFMRSNKVFSGDAWTPTYPQIAYKLNTKAQEKIKKKIDALVPGNVQSDLGGTHLDSSNMESELNRHGDMVTSYRYNYAMKYAFLKDYNVSFELPTEEKPFYSYGEVSNSAVISFAHKMVDGLKTVNALYKQHSSKLMADTELINAIVSVLNEEMLSNLEENTEAYQKFAEEPLYKSEDIDLSTVLGMLEAARRYFHSNGKIESKIDYRNAREKIDDYFNSNSLQEEYEYWLKNLFSDVVAKEGIRNNKDLFTPSGNRRSFEALHYEHTLENVIKAMKEEGTKGIGGFGGGNILGASTLEYNSIDEIKTDAQNRMKTLPESKYDEIKKGFTDRLFELAYSLPIHKDSFTAVDDAANMLIEAVSKFKTKSGMANYLRTESKGWANYSDYIVDDLIELVNDIRNMPVAYFEAKPQRAVGFDEIKAVIMPSQESYEDDLSEVKRELERLNIPILEYEYGDNNDRLKALNSLEAVKFSLKGTSDINTKDVKRMSEIIEHLKGEFETTKFAKADQKALEKMTRGILKDYSSQADFDETFKAIDELYLYMANGENGHSAVWEDVYYKAYEVAQKIVENALVVDDSMYNEYKHLRDYLRNTPMKFYAGFDDVPSSYENFNEFRKKNIGRLKFANDGMSIDSVYQELSDLYPEFFNSEEQINTADQLERILDVLNQIKPEEINPYDHQFKEASMYLAGDITSRFFDIPQAKPTFADKAERRVVEAKIKGNKKVEAVRQQKDEKIKKLIEAQKEKTKKQLDKLREQRDTKVKNEQEKRRAAISKMSESQKVKVLRARIIRHTSELDKTLRKATDKKHIPVELENAVLALLYNINLESNYTYDTASRSYKKNDAGLPTNKTKAFLGLKEVYEQIAKNKDYGLTLASEVFDSIGEGVNNIFDEVMKLSDKKIADMTSEELTKIYDAIRIVEHSISTANKMFAVKKWEGLAETAKEFEKSVATRRAKHALMKSHYTLDIETPITFFSHFGEAGNELYQALRNAQDNEQIMIDELAEMVHGIVSLEQVQKAEKELFEFTTAEGKKLTLSKAHIMDIYLLNNRKQGKKHLLYDPKNEYFGNGIHQPEIKSKHIRRDSESARLTKADIDNIISKLSASDKTIADKLQKATRKLAEWGNKACLEVFGYEKFNDLNYWTIKSATESINQTPENNKDTARSIKNMGSAKAVDDNATNALDIGGVFNVFNQHASDMICYSAWLGAMVDATRLYNYTFRDDAGIKTNRTFVSMLEKYAGEGGSKYYSNLMKDIQNGIGIAPDTATERIYTKLFGKMAKAKVAYKVTVVAQQPMAIIRASTAINPLSIMQAITKGGANLPAWVASKVTKGKVDTSEWYGGWERALKYAPIASRKAIGGYEINSNDSGLKGVIYRPETKKGKFVDSLKESPLWAAGKADEITWGILWNACEIETNKNASLENGSEEYYEAVSRLFTKVINETQVVDGVLQRSQLMRSSSGWIKPLTTFKGEPTMALNGVIRAYDNVRYETDPKKRGQAIKKLSRATSVFLASAVFTAFARSLAVGVTGEDDEEYWEKVWKSFSGIQGDEETWFDFVKNVGLKSDVANNINPLSWLPITSEMMSAMQDYDVERLDVASIGDFVTEAKKFIESLDDEGKQTVGYSLRQLVLKTAEFTGYSPYNLIRDIEGAIRTVRVETNDVKGLYDMEKWRTKPASNVSKYVDILYKAYSTDNEDYEYIYDDMIKNGVDAKKIQNGMETRMKKSQGVKEVSELNKRYMEPAAEKKYDNSLNKIKSSKTWKSANTKQRKEAEAELYNFLTSTSEDMVKTRTEAKMYGVDETEYTLWQLAKEMANTDGKDGLTKLEKANALKMLDLDSDSAWDLYLFKDDSKSATYVRDNGVQSDTYAEFIEALDKYDEPTKSGKYGSYTQEEAYRAINSLKGLSRQEKATLWQSVNSSWKAKNNPFR